MRGRWADRPIREALTMTIILASQAPRRGELLARGGLPVSAQAPDIDETMEPG